jgi:hypothetical protein
MKFITENERHLLHNQLIQMRPSTQSIGNYICLAQMIVDSQIIILYQFQPYSLSEKYIWLGENILQTFVIRVDFTSLAYQIMSPYL